MSPGEARVLLRAKRPDLSPVALQAGALVLCSVLDAARRLGVPVSVLVWAACQAEEVIREDGAHVRTSDAESH